MLVKLDEIEADTISVGVQFPIVLVDLFLSPFPEKTSPLYWCVGSGNHVHFSNASVSNLNAMFHVLSICLGNRQMCAHASPLLNQVFAELWEGAEGEEACQRENAEPSDRAAVRSVVLLA